MKPPISCRHPIGLDIGGANLKASDLEGNAHSVSFELWKHPEQLAVALQSLIASFPNADALAVTMTGELCDCFETKRDGVNQILDHLEQACPDRPIAVWSTGGQFLDTATARIDWRGVAAANWHAQATFLAGELPPGSGLMLDIGSTTTDLVAIVDGSVAAIGKTDPERLQSGELIYVGSRRTPLCAFPLPGICAEFFATMLDVQLLLGQIAEEPENRHTADGRPATLTYSHDRMARMWGADRDMMSRDEVIHQARLIQSLYTDSCLSVIRRIEQKQRRRMEFVSLSGSGTCLAQELRSQLSIPFTSFADTYGPAASECACAFAVARLMRKISMS